MQTGTSTFLRLRAPRAREMRSELKEEIKDPLLKNHPVPTLPAEAREPLGITRKRRHSLELAMTGATAAAHHRAFSNTVGHDGGQSTTHGFSSRSVQMPATAFSIQTTQIPATSGDIGRDMGQAFAPGPRAPVAQMRAVPVSTPMMHHQAVVSGSDGADSQMLPPAAVAQNAEMHSMPFPTLSAQYSATAAAEGSRARTDARMSNASSGQTLALPNPAPAAQRSATPIGLVRESARYKAGSVGRGSGRSQITPDGHSVSTAAANRGKSSTLRRATRILRTPSRIPFPRSSQRGNLFENGDNGEEDADTLGGVPQLLGRSRQARESSVPSRAAATSRRMPSQSTALSLPSGRTYPGRNNSQVSPQLTCTNSNIANQQAAIMAAFSQGTTLSREELGDMYRARYARPNAAKDGQRPAKASNQPLSLGQSGSSRATAINVASDPLEPPSPSASRNLHQGSLPTPVIAQPHLGSPASRPSHGSLFSGSTPDLGSSPPKVGDWGRLQQTSIDPSFLSLATQQPLANPGRSQGINEYVNPIDLLRMPSLALTQALGADATQQQVGTPWGIDFQPDNANQAFWGPASGSNHVTSFPSGGDNRKRTAADDEEEDAREASSNKPRKRLRFDEKIDSYES
ncbi:hypothetical protein HIM_07064 [Hirsutella minnesotensis 3608]|uniref:Uncharacterized protein n=1 Tax=Hirsutella minnesotensis 3608 TaxID=1043627 RepID=A0A0F7ZTQ2_9HYPO|nr:hypothetical protein HIM_07064 [Hirsutella minnesotensis 3608]